MASTAPPVPASPLVAQAPLPPVGQLRTAPSADPSQPPSPLAGMIAGLLPVKTAIDQIEAACQQIVQSGTVPGAAQICSQIVAAAKQLLPMAMQGAMGQMGAGPGPNLPPQAGPPQGIPPAQGAPPQPVAQGGPQ
jgi:hypothetical protein